MMQIGTIYVNVEMTDAYELCLVVEERHFYLDAQDVLSLRDDFNAWLGPRATTEDDEK